MTTIFGLCAAVLLLLLLDLRLLRRAKSGLIVLAYDNIGTPPRNCRLKHLWISEEKFKKQILFIIGKKFKFIGANDLQGSDIAENSVLITFNCGYENFYTNALPILLEFKIRPLVFLTAEGIDSYNFWHDPKNGPWQNMLSAAQIKELKTHSLADFGSNCLTDINMSEAKAEIIENQIKESAFRLQKLYKIKPDFFAYPQATSAVTANMRAYAQATYKTRFIDDNKINALPLKNREISRVKITRRDNLLQFYFKIKGK
jgi:peptidoglycan/xylan/chitin deacetylase (PgdA/CDA1 family)